LRGKKRLSIVWWILCAFMALVGGSTAGIGLWIETTKYEPAGLYCLILSPFLLVAAGIFATLAAKFESEK